MGAMVDRWLHALRNVDLTDQQLEAVAMNLGEARLSGTPTDVLRTLEDLTWINE